MKGLTKEAAGSRKHTAAELKKRTMRITGNLIVYMLLLEFVFVFIYPFLFMIINSFKFDADFRDLNRQWILSGFNWGNYRNALELLNFRSTAVTTVLITLLSTFGHVISCAFIAYGVSRFNFKGRNLVFSLIILSILVPPQILQMPLYIQSARMGLIGTLWPIVLPSFFGFGLKGGLYIFIFMQFFKGLPKSYEEAAKIEGCGSLEVYLKIIMPLSKTSIVVVSILSTIWHWNDIFEPMAYLKGGTKVLTQMLSSMPTYLYQSTTAGGMVIAPVQLAACVLVILPLLLIFAFLQKEFIKGIEFSGLAN